MPQSVPSHVSQDESHEARSQGPAPSTSVWNWNAGLTDGEKNELEQLRASVVELRTEMIELRERAGATEATAVELRAAFQRLVSAKRSQRRRATAELRARGLVT